ncbi:4-hydroxyphenylpyruvate dioxygenase [Streptomyces sp. DHE7-1]|nr:4-hydroxyphenylpyruvate dioxygenase [Streptomyces sp. DHE7-1]
MNAVSIEYVELYTTDRKKTLDYFVSALGFTEKASAEDADRHSSLLRQAEVTVVVTDGPIAEQFCATHGDGVADIGFRCADPVLARESALRAGAGPVTGHADSVTVPGLGSVRHTMCPLSGGLPGDRDWISVEDAGPSASEGHVQRLDHLAVCLRPGTLADTARFYAEAMGLEWFSSEFVEVGDQAMDSVVVRSPSGGVTFTMIEPVPDRAPGQIDDFLARNAGPGVQHLAFQVAEIIPAVREYRRRSAEFLKTPGTYYEALERRIGTMPKQIQDLRETGVLVDRDENGHLLQIFSRSPHERATLFYELIERAGARGFGSANIRALYEAVERERGGSR